MVMPSLILPAKDFGKLVYVILLLTIISSFKSANSDDAVDFQKHLPALVVGAAVGANVELPCDVTPPDGDRVNLVLWFKDSMGMPLYSLDARDGDLAMATHWALGDELGKRTDFLTSGRGPARLRISKLQPDDEGAFRCRIDFFNSPTRNFRVNLTVDVPPSRPMIYDAQENEVTGVAGPFLEGFELFIACHVKGGRPHPNVTWWSGDTLVDQTSESVKDGVTVNRLFIPNVKRTLWNTSFECRAQSSNSTAITTRRVPIEIHLKPRKVNIVTENVLLSAGKSHLLECDSSGSVPPARIVWLLDGEPIRKASTSVVEGSNQTSSTLSFRPVAGDDGKEIVCRAENPRFPGGIKEDRRHIHVAYPPMVTVQLETNRDHGSIKEGDDVVFMCDVRANPQPGKIAWYHDHRQLSSNETAGVFAEDRKLLLRSVAKGSAGEYSCYAANREGESRSSAVYLRVQYAPRCREGFASRRVGALRHDTLTVRCEVTADPGGEEVKFSWTYNRSRDVFPIPGSRVASTGLVSTLDYTPASDLDFGTLACWASNSVGHQKSPCFIHVVSAKVPQPPEDCVLRNRTTGGLEVKCTPGFDGDLPQHFLLEVAESPVLPLYTVELQRSGAMSDQAGIAVGPPLYRILGSEPLFALHSLEPGRDYQLAVFAINAKGKSDPPVIIPRVRVSSPMEKLTGTGEMTRQATTHPMSIVLIALIAAAMLILCGICTTATLVIRRRQTTLKEMRRQEEACRDERSTMELPSVYGEVVMRGHDERKVPISMRRSDRLSDGIEMQMRDLLRRSGGVGIQDEGGGKRLSQMQTLNEPDLIFSRAEVILQQSF